MPRARLAREEFGRVLRALELDRALGVGQQVGAPRWVARASIIRADGKQAITVVDEHEWIRARLSGLRAGRRDDADLVEAG
jgi:hypothetical protein